MYRLFRLIINFFHLIRARTSPVKYARSLGVTVGEGCRLISIVPVDGTFSSEPYLIKLGDHVTVGGDVRFITHDGGVWVFREKEPDIDIFGSIEVGDNVFIGYRSTIMPNVKIGSNVVIGAGSVVTKDIPSNSIAVGVPAKVIKTIDEYHDSASAKKMNIKGLSSTEKRRTLVEKYLG